MLTMDEELEKLNKGFEELIKWDQMVAKSQKQNAENKQKFQNIKLDVLEITRSKASVILKPLPADDPQRRKPDITTAQENLGWSPTILLEQGLVKMMKYFKEELKIK